ncbi:hypothetical protein BZL30_3979 [Mycobacterium kansasii]|uniref:Uncharacterized protein n=1 Tax=Mycobacterium kansasii TaxID=1768 RepID=A0A1V3X965_MYCKA|nr:hypothetical protein BZL30_3979 [Mycobacterium kansasii]
MDGDGMPDDALADFDGDGWPIMPFWMSTMTAPQRATSPTTGRGRGRSRSIGADRCAGLGWMASSTPAVRWSTSTGTAMWTTG